MFKVTANRYSTGAKKKSPLVYGFVNRALIKLIPFVLNSMFQIFCVSDFCSVYPLLHDTPYAIIHGVQIGTVGWPQRRTNESWSFLLKQLDAAEI